MLIVTQHPVVTKALAFTLKFNVHKNSQHPYTPGFSRGADIYVICEQLSELCLKKYWKTFMQRFYVSNRTAQIDKEIDRQTEV